MSLISEKLLKAQPQQIGRIAIGRKHKDGRPPEKFDHFIVTTMERDPETGYFVLDERIHGHPDVGEKPKRLAGFVMFATPEENFHSEMSQWTRSERTWQCDGEECFDPRKGTATGEVEECPRLLGKSCKCSPWGVLRIQLLASPYTLGYHAFNSRGWGSVGNIQGALKDLFARMGTCYQAPVELLAYPREVRYQDSDGQARHGTATTVALVLAMNIEKASAFMVGQKRRQLQTVEELRQIAGKVTTDLAARDGEEIGEFSVDLDGKTEVAQQGEPIVTPPPPSGDKVAQQDETSTAPDTSKHPATPQLLERLESIASTAFKVGKFNRDRWDKLKARVDEGITQAQALVWITKLQELVASVAKDHPDSPPPPTNAPEDGFAPEQRELEPVDQESPSTEPVAADGVLLDHDLPF